MKSKLIMMIENIERKIEMEKSFPMNYESDRRMRDKKLAVLEPQLQILNELLNDTSDSEIEIIKKTRVKLEYSYNSEAYKRGYSDGQRKLRAAILKQLKGK